MKLRNFFVFKDFRNSARFLNNFENIEIQIYSKTTDSNLSTIFQPFVGMMQIIWRWKAMNRTQLSVPQKTEYCTSLNLLYVLPGFTSLYFPVSQYCTSRHDSIFYAKLGGTVYFSEPNICIFRSFGVYFLPSQCCTYRHDSHFFIKKL